MDGNDFRTDGTIDSFANSYPDRFYEIRFDAHEFTSVCPMTGQPDFGTISLVYTPLDRCIELRSWKFYLQTYRNRGIFYENVVNAILDDVVAAISPQKATVIGEFSRRGGISARVTTSYDRLTSPGGWGVIGSLERAIPRARRLPNPENRCWLSAVWLAGGGGV